VTSPVLLFDLDGTLTDPRPGIVGSMRHALESLRRACPPDDVLASYIGPPLRGTFAALLDTADRTRVEEAMRLYRERYGTLGLFENEVYPGIAAMLDEAQGAGSTCFVATAKPAVYAARIVEYFALARHFAGVYGPELDGRLDDKAELLAHLLKTERIAAESCVMIGDRANDVLAATTNGIRAIGVLWGYGTERELRDAGADRLCAAPAELVACVSGL
jgi:phosphoglycolate phosphatase